MVSNVAMLTTDYWPNIGGIAAHVGHLSRALVRRGIRVTVYNFTERKDLPREEWDEGVRVLRFVQWRGRGYWRRWDEIYRLALKVKQAFAADLPDVAHFHTYNEGPILRWGPRRIPRVFTNHSSQYLNKWKTALGRAELRMLIPPCNVVIAPSRELAEKSSLLNVPQSEIHYIPNGVDVNAFDGADGRAVRDRFGIRPEEPVVLCARRLVPKNGVIFFAGAVGGIVREIPSVRILFAGSGTQDYTQSVMECLESQGVRSKAIFAGAVPNNDMPGFYSAADVSVIPSLLEATSVTCLESMACGVPVVVTNVGGLPELVTDGKEGLIVAPRDPKSLSSAIVSLLKDPSRRDEMGQAGRAKARAHYSWEKIAESTAAAYGNVTPRS